MDKVICINNFGVSDFVTEGNEYTIIDFDDSVISVKGDNGVVKWFAEYRFVTKEAYSIMIADNKVEHPVHYNKGIECWDYTTSHNMGFLDGNVVKYVTRYRHKNGLEDLLKAKEYLDKLIEVEKGNN